MKWESVSKVVRGEIMKTDIFCEILCEGTNAETTALSTLENVFQLFRDFEKRYSRFIRDNELWSFNESVGGKISEELFTILEQALYYHISTEKIFDPGILSSLEQAGYTGAYSNQEDRGAKIPFSALRLDRTTLTATKPQELKIDLGGIGKGFITDQVVLLLGQHFKNFIIDAGGDIYAKGINQKENYPYWAIDIEHPREHEKTIALLTLSNMAVATSGRNRRHWQKDGAARHHIIDPRTGTSAVDDFLSVTVIAENTTRADVLAKTLFISGKEKGQAMAETLKIPAVFIHKDTSVTINHYAKNYVWKSH